MSAKLASLAERWAREAREPDVAAAFAEITGREPTPRERQAALEELRRLPDDDQPWGRA